jgi:hypothetical protein
MDDSRGSVIHKVASNRAGLAIDSTNITRPYVTDQTGAALVTNGLLAAAGQKIVTVSDHRANPAIATSVVITNRSGQPVNLLPTVARGAFAPLNRYNGTVQTEQPKQEDYLFPIYLASGESITLDQRILKVLETNAGAGAQTGMGCCYVFTLEPKDR